MFKHLREYKKVVSQKQRDEWRAYWLQKVISRDPHRSFTALIKEDGTKTAQLEK